MRYNPLQAASKTAPHQPWLAGAGLSLISARVSGRACRKGSRGVRRRVQHSAGRHLTRPLAPGSLDPLAANEWRADQTIFLPVDVLT